MTNPKLLQGFSHPKGPRDLTAPINLGVGTGVGHRFPVDAVGLGKSEDNLFWAKSPCVTRPASCPCPPSQPDPIPGAIDLLLLLLILLRVRETKTREDGRSIFFPSAHVPPSSLSPSLSLCGIHAHFSFHPSFCERRAAGEGRKEGRSRGGGEGEGARLFELKKE